MKNILVVFGTRPEAIKLAPFVLQAKKDSRFRTKVCSTGQHREMLKPLLSFFDITPDYDLDLMRPGQSLTDISVGVMNGLHEILSKEPIDAVVVQGDTTSCFVASLVAFYHKVPVVHVEAGLRSGDIYSPYPEEFNRKATGLIASLHFAPTETAKENLLRERYEEKTVFVTGNTGIDALFTVKKKLSENGALKEVHNNKYSFLSPDRKLVLVTIHRRESFGAPMEEVMKGLVALSKRADVELLIPLHMNPQVRASANKIFGPNATWIDKDSPPESGKSKIWLCEPVDYVPFVYLMDKSHLIITDSGGVQEEAPSLGKPILVAREKTERPEAIAAGSSMLIPLEEKAFLKTAQEVLDTPSIYSRMSQAKNPFGDGAACDRILNIMAEKL
ncbi:non-hydrolyzing UDP-N-acetylglucosamine 2-epimerase [Bdellovibrio bacteriovorus]|uniref:non-hydrolyzing UDP-N-acetylglucosamine 2-epimerase n=1 Tax=Bdellovibrio bacteriovorus TaxID=959 RepID=UPI0035A63C56